MHTQNAVEFLLAGKPEDRVALQLVEGDFTYGDLHSAVHEFTVRLQRAGFGPGDRVLLLGINSFPWVAAYLGTLHAGLVCVPLPGSLPVDELRFYLETTEPRAAFVHAPLLARYGSILSDAGVTTLTEDPQRSDGWFRFTSMRAAEHKSVGTSQNSTPPGLASLMFTSGSTGKPRGVMVSHSNIIANTESIIASLQLEEHERMMTVLPFHYCFGASLLHTYLRVGATLVIDNRFSYPEMVLARMASTACTSFAGVPSHYQILLRNSTLGQKPLPHLRSLLQAGGHLAPSFIRQLQQLLPDTSIFIMYGQTEATARLSCLPPDKLSMKLGSIGRAIPGVTLSIMKESGERANPGEVGEIVAEGANVTSGYWRAPEETAKSFRNGKLYTGDIATMDADGFLYVVDRAREFVKCGGTRISFRQIEDRLLEYDELLEAAVIAVPDDVLGEAVRAFVVSRHQEVDHVGERVRRYCKSNLPRTMIPRDIIVVDSLPKNTYGKVLRPRLKDLAPDVQGDVCLEMTTGQAS